MVETGVQEQLLETSLNTNLGDLSHKISVAATQLSTIIEAVGGTFPELDKAIASGRMNSISELRTIQSCEEFMPHARSAAQTKAANIVTDTLSIHSGMILRRLDGLIEQLRDVVQKANAEGIFSEVSESIKKLSCESLATIGSVRSRANQGEEILSLEHSTNRKDPVVQDLQKHHEKLYDVTASCYRQIQELIGVVVIAALTGFDGNHPAPNTSSSGDRCDDAKALINHTIDTIDRTSPSPGTVISRAETSALRQALYLLHHVVDKAYNKPFEPRPLARDLTGQTRTTSEIHSALTPVSGNVEHLVRDLGSDQPEVIAHSLEQIGKLGAQLDQLISQQPAPSQVREFEEVQKELKLTHTRDQLITALESSIQAAENPGMSLQALSCFGLAGLASIRGILFNSASSDDLKNSCLSRLSTVLRSKLSPSAPPAEYVQWYKELDPTLNALNEHTQLQDKIKELRKLCEQASLAGSPQGQTVS